MVEPKTECNHFVIRILQQIHIIAYVDLPKLVKVLGGDLLLARVGVLRGSRVHHRHRVLRAVGWRLRLVEGILVVEVGLGRRGRPAGRPLHRRVLKARQNRVS